MAKQLEGVRVHFVLPSLHVGGAERQALLLARHLSKMHGAHVLIWGIGEPGDVVGECERSGLLWRALSIEPPPDSRAKRASVLASVALALAAERPDVLLPYAYMPNVYCGALWRRVGARACIWNQRDDGFDRAILPSDRRAAKNVRLFVANSKDGAEFLRARFGVSRARIRIVFNGVERTRPIQSRTAWRRSLGLKKGDFAGCMLANVSENKDHATLLRAWRALKDMPTASERGTPILCLAGELRGAHPRLLRQAEVLRIEERVRFLGSISDITGLLDAMDFGVHSAPSEGCPNAVLECMAAGLPVVACDIESIRHAVGPVGSTLLVPCGEPRAFAECIDRLLADARLRARIGAANAARAGDVFAPARMCSTMVEIIAKSLNAD